MSPPWAPALPYNPISPMLVLVLHSLVHIFLNPMVHNQIHGLPNDNNQKRKLSNQLTAGKMAKPKTFIIMILVHMIPTGQAKATWIACSPYPFSSFTLLAAQQPFPPAQVIPFHSSQSLGTDQTKTPRPSGHPYTQKSCQPSIQNHRQIWVTPSKLFHNRLKI